MKKAVRPHYIAAAYARYSTDHQQESSITAQLNAILAYCEREGIELVPEPYVDEARTGTNMQREGFQRLLADAHRGKFNSIVVYDVSRGSRNVADWFSFRAEMGRLGIHVFSVTDRLGAEDDPSAFLTELLTVGIGQHQALQSRQKSIAGKRVRAQQGLFCGGVAPLGYTIANGRYEINPTEAEAVKHIHEMYMAGYSYSDIQAILKPRNRAGRILTKPALYDILKNPRYGGKYIWFEREERHMHKHVGRPGDDPIVLDGIIPAIVSPDLKQAVLAKMERKKKMSNATKHDYLLSGVIRCGECGGAMFGMTNTSRGKQYRYYSCLKKRAPEQKCHARNCRAENLEDYIIKQIKQFFLHPDTMDKAADMFISQDILDRDVKNMLERERVHVKNEIGRLVNILAKTDDAPMSIVDTIRENETRLRELEERIAKECAPEPVTKEDVIARLSADAAQLDSDPAALKEIVLHYVKEILVYDTKIEVIWQIKKTATDENIDDRCESVGSPGAGTVTFTTSITREAIAA